MHEVIVVLGSNINPEKNLYSAWIELGRRFEIRNTSSIWLSPPSGSTGPNFLNAVVAVATEFSIDSFKWDVLREIEAHLGRIRTADKFAPRSIDLDILIFDGIVRDANLWKLAYLAAPCAEIFPHLMSPANELLSEIAARISAEQKTFKRYSSFQELTAASIN